MAENDLRLLAVFVVCIHGRAVHRIATRRIPAVCPIQDPIGSVEVQINRLRKVFIKKLNISAILGRLSWRDDNVGPENSTVTGVAIAFLRPINLAALDVYSNAHTPLPRVRPWA